MKLEKVITDSMKDIKRVREDRLELEEYRKNGISHNRSGTNEEILRLQKLVAQLQQQNNHNNHNSRSLQQEDQSEL